MDFVCLFEDFRTPFGLLTIVLGLHFLPIFLYMINSQLLFGWSPILLHNLKNLCIIGRLFSFYCEVRYFYYIEKKNVIAMICFDLV